MARVRRYMNRIHGWELTGTAVNANADEVPQLVPALPRLQELTVQARNLWSQQAALNAKLRGHYEYYGRFSNYQGLLKFYRVVKKTWRKWLSRRMRGATLTWDTYNNLLKRYRLLLPRITHPLAGSRSPA